VKKTEREQHPDPYGDETPLVEPTRPIKPVEPNQPRPSPVSNYEMQSVGRVYFNLTKPEPSRWKKLVAEEI